ncbi:glycosyltransferase involved in cell wall biosynthesis [Mucilaginibacter frigoritolerans]|uniref:Glycosyltransferase involved in cell wall biosynthesis n=1 Tax=Mucilaginibacter frigoritolerans TaxID=652788 RepID=A0A562TPU5_9SPHI|nr:glycosyltransferase family 1 protein [Mucilaginibacter frigoritolerans]TWI95621.1 glycosyltransferase involved in cell wall biosynthesis [Mucilaginibacter frigoritolerans]
MIIVNARFLTQKVTGVQRFAIEISKVLHKLNSEIVFVTPFDVIDSDLARELGAIVVGKNKGVVWEQIDLRFYLRSKGKPLLVNFCNTGMIFYKNQAVTIHDMSYRVNPRWFSWSFYLWYNFLIPHIAKRCLRLFTVSNSSKKDILKYLNIKQDKITVVYNSSNLNTNNNFEQIETGRYLLSVSSLDPRKNLNNLLKAYKDVDEKVNLLIVGLKKDNFELDETLLSERIIIKNYVSDDELASLMRYAEAFIYLSFYEGFGLPPLEAMSMGCPVIVSDISAHREVCLDAALYADPYNIEDIKEKIINLLTNNKLKTELTLAGKENLKRFNWLESGQKVLKNINELV